MSVMTSSKWPLVIAILLFSLSAVGCGASALPVVPTTRPTETATSTAAPTRTPARDVTPTDRAPTEIFMATGGPSPTPLFGPTTTIIAQVMTNTPPPNPNAPRIEFFTNSPSAIAPGDSVTLYWSTRGTTSAVIYRIENGVRNQVWNVGPDGNLSVPTRRVDRGSVDFILVIGNGSQEITQSLSVSLACPDVWFFQPAPDACPTGPAQEAQLTEQEFERGRMVYVATANTIYSLFNDGIAPAWVSFENRFNPALDPESELSFVPPPGFYQPTRQLGAIWRGNDSTRNRLGLGTDPESIYAGFVQTSTAPNGDMTVYLSGADGIVLQLLPQGEIWQIITPP